MGSAVIQARLPQEGGTKCYDLVVSNYQMCILFLFNYKEQISIEEIKD